jgi:energy-coupling factor transporter ATP-binding protein EcfA2
VAGRIEVNMVRATWFEDISGWNQPFVYGLSIRQLIVLGVLGFTSYLIAAALWPLGVIPGLLVPIMWFMILGTFFLPRQRIVQPEQILWGYLKSRLARRTKREKEGKGERRRSREERQSQKRDRFVISPGQQLQLSGQLIDPATGKPIPNQEVEMFVSGRIWDTTRTDKDGRYSFVFVPDREGLVEIEVRPKDRKEGRRILVSVGPAPPLPVSPAPEARTGASERVSAPEPEEYTYELFPVNFALLSPEEQRKVTDRFRFMLNSLTVPVSLHILPDCITLPLDQPYPVRFLRFFLTSRYPLDPVLEESGFRYRRVEGLPRIPPIVSTAGGGLALDGGNLAKVFSISSYPELLKEGFITELYRVADRIEVKIQVYPSEKGRQIFKRFYDRIKANVSYEARRRRGPVPEELQLQLQAAQDLYTRIVSGASKLLRVGINITVVGRDREELRVKEKSLMAILEGNLIRVAKSWVDKSTTVQRDLYTGRLTAWSIMDTDTAGCIFPFISADLMEPDGMFLGINLLRGTPVLYDPYLRKNQNMCIIGVTGSGKSFAAKCLLSRFLDRHPRCLLFVIDPEGEYYRAIGPKGVEEIRISPDVDLGLDPFFLFPDDRGMVSSLLEQMLGLKEEEDKLKLRELVMRCSSLEELRGRATGRLRKYLDIMLRGPESFIFRGEKQEIPDKVIFNLRSLQQIPGGEERILNLASFLIFTSIWRKIERAPPNIPKVVSVDEAWRYLQYPVSAKFMDTVVRQARKRGCALIIATQNPADVMSIREGKSVLDNSATKFLFAQSPTTREMVADAFGLSPVQREKLPELEKGECIMLTEDQQLLMKWCCLPEEYPDFTTTPIEAG